MIQDTTQFNADTELLASYDAGGGTEYKITVGNYGDYHYGYGRPFSYGSIDKPEYDGCTIDYIIGSTREWATQYYCPLFLNFSTKPKYSKFRAILNGKIYNLAYEESCFSGHSYNSTLDDYDEWYDYFKSNLGKTVTIRLEGIL